jgi:hypothetical protein
VAASQLSIETSIERPTKRLRSDSAALSPPPASNPSPPSNAGSNKITPSTQPSVLALSKKARIEQLTALLDLDIIKFLCVAGVSLRAVDLPQWKKIWEHTNPSYTPASATKISDSQIPQEASFVRAKQLELLRNKTNLTLTFDGNSTRLPQSVYTIHIITADRRVYFFEGHEGSEDSHTAEYLFGVVKNVSCIDNCADIDSTPV